MKTIKAKKSLGQNFLIDHDALSDIAHAIEVSGKHIIEVGPGYGALTQYLIDQGPKSLDLIELDTDMIKILHEKYPQSPQSLIQIHHHDILNYFPVQDTYSVIANIPYYITSPILFHFLYPTSSEMQCPEYMVIMMQKEVGEKILAGKGKKIHHSFLSLCMEQACDSIDIVRLVGRASFDPMPKVDSIVLRFMISKQRNLSQEQQRIQLWKHAFMHPRKTLLSNLRGSQYDINHIRDILLSHGYSEQVRAEAIKQEDWNLFL